jgi:chromosome segregation ATPase
MTRARHERDMAGLRAEIERLRKQRDDALSGQSTAVFNREQVIRQLAEADAANRRLHGRNLELGQRLTSLTEADPEYTAVLDRRVARLKTVGARVLAAYGRERHRADLLQARLDDAVGLHHGGHIIDSSRWQPGYITPKPEVTA